MKKLNEITIADLMPDSISRDLEVSATAQAIDPQLKAISEAVDSPLILASIDELGSGVLEHLAVQYDVTAWNSAWPIETKRAVLKTAIADKRKIGTRGAVQRAIEAVAPIATITEWWQDTSGEMPPHTFKIDLLQEGSAVDAETQASVIEQVNAAKPVRSHYTFTAIQNAESGFYFAGVIRSIAYARVRSAGISIEQMGIQAGVLAAMRGMAIRHLMAETEMGELPPAQIPVVGGMVTETSDYKIRMLDPGGLLFPSGYAYQDGDLLDMQWDFGGMVEEYVPLTPLAIGGVMTAITDSKFYGDIFGVLELDALPTVKSLNGVVGTLSQQGTQASVADGDSVYHYIYVDSAYQLCTIGAGNTLGVVRISNNSAENSQRGVGWIAERTSDGYVKITNNSGTTYVNLYGAWLAYCDSTRVTVVTVYKLSDSVAYNAFKYTLIVTDYYYVLDNTTASTMDWTDDLGSIGYSLVL